MKFVGIGLICLSVSAFVVVSVAFSHFEYIGGGSSGSGMWIVGKVSFPYGLPILLCGAVGVVCFLWPTRKPPKLPKS